jgi:hypothetical protein
MNFSLRLTLVWLAGFLLPWGLARADYGWIPDYQELRVRAGLDFFRSTDNFDTTGQLQPLALGGQPTQFGMDSFYVEPEYGIAQDTSIWLRFGFLSNSLTAQSSDATFASGSGLGDIRASVKWNVKPTLPLVTIEAMVKIPTYTPTPANATDLVLGDGNLDFGIILHTAHRLGMMYFTLDPGFLFRFGGYSLAGTLGLSGEFRFLVRGYVRLFADGIFSLTDTPLYDTSPTVHNAVGSGGSYALLSGSPTGFSGGAKIGVPVYKSWVVEGSASHSVVGTRYPNFFQFGFSVLTTFDFFQYEGKSHEKKSDDT